MGSGKTSVARDLCKKTGLPYLDTDAVLEDLEGQSIADIFNDQGEAYFRHSESRLCETLLTVPPSVISTGGGIILSETNRAILPQLGTVVFLDASVETLSLRLKEDTSRPLLNTPHLCETLRSLLTQRRSLYEKTASLIITTDTKTTPQIAQEILDRIY